MDIVQDNINKGAHYACQELIQTAAVRWQEEEGDYRDDVSSDNTAFSEVNIAGCATLICVFCFTDYCHYIHATTSSMPLVAITTRRYIHHCEVSYDSYSLWAGSFISALASLIVSEGDNLSFLNNTATLYYRHLLDYKIRCSLTLS